MATLFISDLHLEDRRPEMTAALTGFLRKEAREADAVYILGDLFEFWIGDDVLTDTAREVARELSALAVSGTPCYFQHGNRDFLLGDSYASQAGLKLLPELHLTDLYGTPTLLLHGDTLCTDDIAYQAFRQQVRNDAFRAHFLGLPVTERLSMAANARDASKQHTGMVSMEIMDVNKNAVRAAFEQHGIRSMIHGHTHRPAIHNHTLSNGESARRYVLADWYANASYLRVGRDGIEHVSLGGLPG